MLPTKDLTALSHDELVKLVVDLQGKLAQALATIEALRKENAELRRAGMVSSRFVQIFLKFGYKSQSAKTE